jgi:predicted DNA-binding transcriptional regulator AlpA
VPERPPTLTDVLDTPARALELSATEAAAMLARVEGVASILRIAAGARPSPNGDHAPEVPDRLIGVDEAARRLGITPKALYARAEGLPFTRRLGAGTLRFSEAGLGEWIERTHGSVSRRGHGAHGRETT